MYFKTVRRHELNYKLSPNAFIGKLLGISVAWYSLFVLKVPLKPNQPTFGDFWRRIFISWISFLSPSEQHQCMTVGRFFCACLWITYLCTERCVKFFFITIIVSRVRRWRTWKPIMTQQPQHFAQLANSSSVLSSVCLNLNIINNYFINYTVRTECKGIWYQPSPPQSVAEGWAPLQRTLAVYAQSFCVSIVNIQIKLHRYVIVLVSEESR